MFGTSIVRATMLMATALWAWAEVLKIRRPGQIAPARRLWTAGIALALLRRRCARCEDRCRSGRAPAPPAPPRRSRLSSISAGVTRQPGQVHGRPALERRAGTRAACTRLRVTTSGEVIHRRVSSGTGHTASMPGQRLADDAADKRRHRGVRRAGPDRHRRHAADDAVDESAPRVLAHQEFGDRLRRAVRRLRQQRHVLGHAPPAAGRRRPPRVLENTKRGGRRQPPARLEQAARVASTLIRMPRSNSASDCPLSDGGQVKDDVDVVVHDGVDECRIGDGADSGVDARVGDRAGRPDRRRRCVETPAARRPRAAPRSDAGPETRRRR